MLFGVLNFIAAAAQETEDLLKDTADVVVSTSEAFISPAMLILMFVLALVAGVGAFVYHVHSIREGTIKPKKKITSKKKELKLQRKTRGQYTES